MPLSTEHRNELIQRSLAVFNPGIKDFSYDHALPTRAVGHATGLATAGWITRSYRRDHRPKSLNVEPQQVIDVLNAAHVRRWVLVGLYGYAGYLTQPRATQDVDILVPAEEFSATLAAIAARWPELIISRHDVVAWFLDPGEVAIDGELKQVIDVMLPSNGCYQAIIDRYHRIDAVTGHRIPVLEGAIASKYAALVSPHRQWDRKQQDAVDLRNIILPNQEIIDSDRLVELGELVFPGGGAELLEFLQLAIQRRPFPV